MGCVLLCRVMPLVLTIALTSVGRRLLGQTWSVRQSGAHGCVASLCCGPTTDKVLVRPAVQSQPGATFGVVRVSEQPERFVCPIVAAQDG